MGGNMENIIEIEGVTKSYGNKCILRNIDLNIDYGDFTLITGKSGCGKTTLLNIIGTLDTYDGGRYIYKGKNTSKYAIRENLRANEIGFVFQSYGLLENHTVVDNIIIPLFYNNMKITRKTYCIIDDYVNKFGLGDVSHTKVKYLSGGERQRVGIIRALMKDPSLILADEPTGNLDPDNSILIAKELKELSQNGKAVVVVTHNSEFFSNPTHKYTIENGVLVNA